MEDQIEPAVEANQETIQQYDWRKDTWAIVSASSGVIALSCTVNILTTPVFEPRSEIIVGSALVGMAATGIKARINRNRQNSQVVQKNES